MAVTVVAGTPKENKVDYDVERIKNVAEEGAKEVKEISKTYDDMINGSNEYYNAQIDATKEWEKKQTQLQQEQTDFAINQINQQKEQTTKDYTKEQSGAYTDWQEESNKYGVNAEQMASQGLSQSGYSESSKVSMYNTYQNRVAIARETYNKAIMNYDNSITQAKLQNNSILAEIAYNSLQQQLELSLQGFQYKNQLVLAKTDAVQNVKNTYYSRYQDVLNQINTEKAQAENIRQFEKNYDLQKQELERQKENDKWEKEQAEKSWEYQLKQDKIANAFKMASLGTYSNLEKLGFKIDYTLINEEKNSQKRANALQEAVIAAEVGDFSKLEQLGITPSDEYKQSVIENLNNSGILGKVDEDTFGDTSVVSESTYENTTLDDKTIEKAGFYNPTQLNITKEIDKSKNMAIDKIKNWGKNIPSGQLFFPNELPKAIVTGNTVTSVFYQGDLNTDGKTYGYMKNGYQPKGISGHGLLRPSGRQTSFVATTINGVNVYCTQNIWVAEDDETLWIWNGKENEYEPYDIEE